MKTVSQFPFSCRKYALFLSSKSKTELYPQNIDDVDAFAADINIWEMLS